MMAFTTCTVHGDPSSRGVSVVVADARRYSNHCASVAGVVLHPREAP